MINLVSKQAALRTDEWSKNLNDDHSIFLLSKDFEASTILRDRGLNLISLGKKFHSKSNELQNEFLELFKKMASQNQYDAYWMTQIASRNSAGITLFQDIIYLFLALDESEKSQNITFIIDSQPLLKTLNHYFAKEKKYQTAVYNTLKDRLWRLKLFIATSAKLVLSIIKFVTIWTYVRLKLKKKKHYCSENYLIKSWLTSGSFKSDGTYKDRNFGQLPDFFKEKKKNVVFYPDYFNLNKSIFKVLKEVSSSSENIVIPEHSIPFFQYMRPLYDGVLSLFANFKDIKIRSILISSLISEAHLKSSLSFSHLRGNLFFFYLKQLAKDKTKIKKVIYAMENNAPEKTTIIATKKYFPETKTVGFQHTVWYKEQLGMFLGLNESHPLPDEILLKGKKYLEVFKNAGFPDKKLRVGCNLRYTDVFKPLDHNITSSSSTFTISIVLTYDLNQAKEVLYKVAKSTQGLSEVDLVIKTHPVTNKSELECYLKKINFPNYTFASKNVIDLTLHSDLIIMSCTSVSNLEVIITGKPLLRVSLDSSFDFDPLWEGTDVTNGQIVYSTESLRQEILKIKNKQYSPEKLSQFSNLVKESYFEPVTNEQLDKFL